MNENYVYISITKPIKGGVDGLYPMQFEAGKVYYIDIELAKIFTEIGIGTISARPEHGYYEMHLVPNGGQPFWRLVIPKSEDEE